jgi:hypothetical protein
VVTVNEKVVVDVVVPDVPVIVTVLVPVVAVEEAVTSKDDRAVRRVSRVVGAAVRHSGGRTLCVVAS